MRARKLRVGVKVRSEAFAAKVMVELRIVEKQGWGKVGLEMRVRVRLTKF